VTARRVVLDAIAAGVPSRDRRSRIKPRVRWRTLGILTFRKDASPTRLDTADLTLTKVIATTT
jgi:hypothetical protein